MRTTHRLTAATAVFAAAASALAGCAGSPAALPDEPVVLTILHIDGGPELDPAVEWFATAVAEASDGAVTVEVVRGCCDDATTIEEDLIGQVADGGADLGWVGTRAFEGLGVDALLPLTAPLLLDGYALQEQILSSDAAADALRDVEAAGVTGIALVPGQIRRPLAIERPIVSPTDWTGVPVASFHSAQSAASFTALGADPHDVTFAERDEGLFDRSLLALENSLTMQDLEREEILPYATSNVALWPRTSALVADPASLAATDDEVRRALMDAAASVVARTKEFAAIDQAAVDAACGDGARFAEASGQELDALRAAVEPIWSDLAERESTAALYAAIVEARAGSEPEVPQIAAECTGTAPTSSAPVGDGDVTALNGAWATPTRTLDELSAAGFDRTDATNAAGRFTMRFDDGDFVLDVELVDGMRYPDTCHGTYALGGSRVIVTVEPGGCGPGGTFFSAETAIDAASLTLTDFEDTLEIDAFLFGDAPLTKVE